MTLLRLTLPCTSAIEIVAEGERTTHERKEQQMAYGIVHQFSGGTQEQYEATLAVVHPSDGSLPEGQMFHAAGPSADGWTVVAIHDSQESWERFRDDMLMPRLNEGIQGGFPTPPQETAFTVHNQQPG
jgi:hypothetical protein